VPEMDWNSIGIGASILGVILAIVFWLWPRMKARGALHAQISFSDLHCSPKLVKAFGFLRTLRESALVRMIPFDETTPESRTTIYALNERLTAQAAAALPERPLLDADNLTTVTLTNTGKTTLKSVRVAVPQALDAWIVTADKEVIESDNRLVALLPSLPPKAVAHFYFLTYIKMWPHQEAEISITHDGGIAKRTVVDPVAKHPFFVSRNFNVLRSAMASIALGVAIAALLVTPPIIWLIRFLIPLLQSLRH
jgi:hypothetical protein